MDTASKGGGIDGQSGPVHALYRLMTAHWEAGTLMAAVRLDLFTQLAKGPATAADLATRCGAQPLWIEKLLVACTALGLVQRIGAQYQNAALAQDYLVKSSPMYQGDLALHFNDMWERFGELEYTARTSRRGPKEISTRKARSEKEAAEANQTWVRGMHNIAVGGQAAALADTVDLSDRSRLCDVGGGAGSYAMALCERYPNLQALVLEVAEILPLTNEHIRNANMSSRVRTRACDFLRDSYGIGHDVILLSGLIHGFGAFDGKLMLRKSYDALASGGAILVQELLLRDDKTGPLLPALFSLNMTMGGSYSGAEIVSWMRETGFTDVEVRPIRGYGWLDSVVVARKP